MELLETLSCRRGHWDGGWLGYPITRGSVKDSHVTLLRTPTNLPSCKVLSYARSTEVTIYVASKYRTTVEHGMTCMTFGAGGVDAESAVSVAVS
jgi:hypothetical protein